MQRHGSPGRRRAALSAALSLAALLQLAVPPQAAVSAQWEAADARPPASSGQVRAGERISPYPLQRATPARAPLAGGPLERIWRLFSQKLGELAAWGAEQLARILGEVDAWLRGRMAQELERQARSVLGRACGVGALMPLGFLALGLVLCGRHTGQ